MSSSKIRSTVAAVAALSFAVAACGSGDGDDADDGAAAGAGGDSSEMPTIVVTTNILGDVVGEVVGDAAAVVTIMPVGADPHDFQASAQEVDSMMSADALIVNGASFEEGLLDVVDSAEDAGVPTYEAISAIDAIEFGAGGHDHDDHDHDDEGTDESHDHDHDDHDHDDEGHDHAGDDPHFFTDPVRMAAAVDGLVDFLQGEIDFVDPAAIDASAEAYVAELITLDAESEALLAAVPEENRTLVTNHEVFGYFADRYDFEIAGVVVPGGSTTDSASAGELAELVDVIDAEGVPAIFSDTSSSDQLVRTLADEVGDIQVVSLYTESLGEPGSDGETYLDMVRSNAERISGALG